MKIQNYLVLLASSMLLAMNLASCKMSNKPAPDLSGFDATDALDYFLTHLNQGRPFILAGHSQGSSILINLLENYMTKHPEHLSRMVAAYPIGFAVTKDFLQRTGLKFAEGAKPFALNEESAISIFGPECYHREDYGFFYNNLKQNVSDRIKAFLEK